MKIPVAHIPLLCLCALGLLACPEAPLPQSEASPSDATLEIEAQIQPTQAMPEATLRPRGLWILCEGSQRILEHPERIPELLADAKALGVSDLFVQVYRGGRAWFNSSKADAVPYRAIIEQTGRDTLAELIAAAQREGFRVHAWVNVLSLAGNRDAAILAELGMDAIAVDRKGRSVLSYAGLELPEYPLLRMGTPAVWLDPAAPGVARWLASMLQELALRYPELDGIHFDYIRYPDVLPFAPGSRFGVGMDFGYGAATRQRFFEETGREAPFRDRIVNANQWDQWRREKLGQLIDDVRSAARVAQPDLLFSAAVLAYPERAYLSMFQDWRGWLDEGLLDFAVPMLYTLDDRLLRYEAAAYVGGIGGERVWIGLGSWLFAKNPARALQQIETVRQLGAHGDALFSWDSIAENPEFRAALAEALTGESVPAASFATP